MSNLANTRDFLHYSYNWSERQSIIFMTFQGFPVKSIVYELIYLFYEITTHTHTHIYPSLNIISLNMVKSDNLPFPPLAASIII